MNSMSSDREEIRWKFQVMLDVMNNTIQLLDNERSGIMQGMEKYTNEKKEIRNTLLGMIAFGIGLLVSLVSINILEESMSWLIIPGIIGASAVYLITNIRNYSYAMKIHQINQKYLMSLDDLIKIKGFFTGLSVREEINKEHVYRLFEYAFLTNQIFGYELGHEGHKIVNTPKPSQEQYRITYNTIKEKIDQIKEIGFQPIHPKFELFIQEFEKNEKR